VAVTLVGGGARSGKSRYALELARRYGTRLRFIATAEASDSEMADRIARHRAERSADFVTLEAPMELALAMAAPDTDAIVIDCLTLWLSNVMLARRDVESEIKKVLDAAQHSRPQLIFVTNEVGCGIVPETPLGREFRDWAGILNQRIAAIAEEVYWMVFGHPLRVK
jgi:adenosylcobinamide kinase / adenosylcobinamide-phosphate guanylyltransferase